MTQFSPHYYSLLQTSTCKREKRENERKKERFNAAHMITSLSCSGLLLIFVLLQILPRMMGESSKLLHNVKTAIPSYTDLEAFQKAAYSGKVQDLSVYTHELRWVKSPAELKLLRESASIACQVFPCLNCCNYFHWSQILNSCLEAMATHEFLTMRCVVVVNKFWLFDDVVTCEICIKRLRFNNRKEKTLNNLFNGNIFVCPDLFLTNAFTSDGKWSQMILSFSFPSILVPCLSTYRNLDLKDLKVISQSSRS